MTFFKPNSWAIDKYTEFKNIHPGIWKMENFLSEDTVKKYLGPVEAMSEKEWENEHWSYQEGDLMGTFWHSRMSKLIYPHEHIHNEFYKFFAPEYIPLGMYRSLNRMLPGEITTPELCLMPNGIKNHNNFNAKYRIGVYLGQFAGGELIFPDINFTVPVKENDVVVWEYDIKHYVAPVISGVRYSYSEYLVTPADLWFS